MSASLFTRDVEGMLFELSAADDVKPVLADGLAGNRGELDSVGSEVSTWTVVLGGRPSFGREAGLLPSRMFAILQADQ